MIHIETTDHYEYYLGYYKGHEIRIRKHRNTGIVQINPVDMKIVDDLCHSNQKHDFGNLLLEDFRIWETHTIFEDHHLLDAIKMHKEIGVDSPFNKVRIRCEIDNESGSLVFNTDDVSLALGYESYQSMPDSQRRQIELFVNFITGYTAPLGI